MQDEPITGTITREDAATICVRALSKPPQQALIFEVLRAVALVALVSCEPPVLPSHAFTALLDKDKGMRSALNMFVAASCVNTHRFRTKRRNLEIGIYF